MTPPVGALLGLVLGLVAGSFLSTLVLRWPRGDGVMRGRSRCDGCGRPLRARDLVPLASYTLAGGRCQSCRAPIDPRHPAMEAGCAAAGAAALALHPDAGGVGGALLLWLLLTLAVLDLDHLWLPDALTGAVAAGGLAGGWAGLPPALADRAIGAAAGFLLLEAIRRGFRLVRRQDGMGAGDPKLFGALGAWLGWAPLPAVLGAAALLGIGWAAMAHWRGRAVARDTPVPFGAALAAAGGLAWLLG